MLIYSFIFILWVIYILFSPLLFAWIEARKDSGRVRLVAKKTGRVNFLSFTKGEIYDFWKSGDILIANADDLSNDRDNYVFYKEEINRGFSPTNYYSAFVLRSLASRPR